MSRIGRLPIPVPAGVEVSIDGREVTVKGPKGTLSHTVVAPISIEKSEDGTLQVSRPNDERIAKERHGLTRTLVANMVTGVTTGYSKVLEISGVGYRVQAKGADLEFALGYSHPITINPPDGIKFTVETPTRLVVAGIDKQQVGEVAAKIRKLRKPDPYKAKGVRYQGEVIRRKVGKAGEVAMVYSIKIAKGDAKKSVSRKRRHIRVRKRVNGTPERPRLVVTRSNRHMVVQVVDDRKGHTLASASTLEGPLRAADGSKVDRSREVGKLVAERAKAAGVTQVVFDRAGNKYHGRVAAVADGAREAGLSL